jgi:hypothetical protein
LGALGKGEVALLTKRGEGGVAHSFDDLAMGLDTGAITRRKAMKLGGAALVASALGVFGAREAQADEITTEGRARRRCNQKGGDFCKHKGKCKICCGEGRRRRRACCGSEGCNCCRPGETCRNNGRCT